VQRLGKKNTTYRYTIPYLDGLKSFAKGNLFKDTFEAFYDACKDGDPGELIDPIYGSIRASVVSFSENIQPGNIRNGTTVEVEFIESPESLPAEKKAYSLPQLKREEQKVVSEAVEFPEVKEFTKSLTDPFDFPTGLLDQISASRDRILSQIDAKTAQVQRMSESIDKVTDPEAWRVREAIRDFNLSLIRTSKNAVNRSNFITQKVISNPIPIANLASDLKMQFNEFLALNEELINSPIVPAGSVVKFKKIK